MEAYAHDAGGTLERADLEPKPGGSISLPQGKWQNWGIEPTVRRGNDGVSRRLDQARLKALGNAVVPQQAYPILESIAKVERWRNLGGGA